MTKPTSIKLDEELRSRVQQLAEARQRSAHWLMREAIEQYVEREEQRESFKRDTLNAWNDYQTTGRHASVVEVENWLESWGSPGESAAPKCQE